MNVMYLGACISVFGIICVLICIATVFGWDFLTIRYEQLEKTLVDELELAMDLNAMQVVSLKLKWFLRPLLAMIAIGLVIAVVGIVLKI